MLTTDSDMATVLSPSPIGPSPLERVLHLLAPEFDRRQQSRVAAPYLFLLTPMEDLTAGCPGREAAPPITVVGKDLSGRGIAFYHEAPLAYRYARLRLDDPQIGCCEIDVQLNHCRFTKLGWYESGGRVLRVRD